MLAADLQTGRGSCTPQRIKSILRRGRQGGRGAAWQCFAYRRGHRPGSQGQNGQGHSLGPRRPLAWQDSLGTASWRVCRVELRFAGSWGSLRAMGLTEKVSPSTDQKQGKEGATGRSGGKVLKAKRAAGTKALG